MRKHTYVVIPAIESVSSKTTERDTYAVLAVNTEPLDPGSLNASGMT